MDVPKQDGTISMFSCQQLLCIEYPGFIQNVDNMLSTLGGTETVARTHFQTKEKLELRFRPSDSTCKAAHGNLHKHHGVLLRVKRRRKRKAEDGQPGPWHYEQNVLGIVNGVYKFETLMDFQYLQPPQRNHYQQLFGRELLNLNEQFFPIPRLFARIDTPGAYQYRGTQVDVNAKPSRWRDEESQMTRDPDTKIRKERKGFGLAAVFNSDSVPHEPLSENKEKVGQLFEKFPIVKGDADHLIALFEERPLWQRADIEHTCRLTKEMFKHVLPCYAYYWINGPWSKLWCRLGYDPRKDPEAMKYQQCECRIKFGGHEMLITSKRKALRQRKTKSVAPVFEGEQSSNQLPENKRRRGFHPDRLPDNRQFKYQLCDINDDEVIKLINDCKATECTEKDGFLQEGTLDKVREVLKKRITSKLLSGKKASMPSGTEERNVCDDTMERETGRGGFSDEDDED